MILSKSLDLLIHVVSDMGNRVHLLVMDDNDDGNGNGM